MGRIIEDLKKSKPEFRSELDSYIQQVKLENSEELTNLHSTISSLREQLESSKFNAQDLVQQAIFNKSDEINQLKSTILRKTTKLNHNGWRFNAISRLWRTRYLFNC